MAQSGSNSNITGALSRVYVLSWAALGLMAAAYLSALYARPQWVSASFWRPAGEHQAENGQRSMSKALERETGRVRQARAVPRPAKTAKPRNPAADEIAARFGGADLSHGDSARPGEPTSAPAGTGTSRPRPAGTSQARTAVTAAAAPLPAERPLAPAAGQTKTAVDPPASQAPNVKILVKVPPAGPDTPSKPGVKQVLPAPAKSAAKAGSAKKTARVAKAEARITAPKVDVFGGGAMIETGSVTMPAALAFGPAVVTRAKTPVVGVHIASGPSLAALRLSWLQLTDRHGAALGTLAPRYSVSGPRGARRYRLMAGPLPSSKMAAGLCSELRRMNDSCAVTPFKGRRF